MLSIVCEAFNCTPDVAMQQNPRLIKNIMDYRLADATVSQFNDDASKMTPEMVTMMKLLQENLNEE